MAQFAQLRLQLPDQFNFRTPDDWPRWLRRFQQYRVASGLATAEEAQQISTLLYAMGEEAEEVLKSTGATEERLKTFDDVVAQFAGYFQVRRNVIYERARFNRRNQQDGETAEHYIMELYSLAENCDYGTLKEEMIRDRLVVGIKDTTLSQHLQLDSELTLDKAKTKIRQREAVGEQQRELTGTKQDSSNELDAVHYRGKFTPRKKVQHGQQRGRSRTRDTPSNKRCRRCGKSPHSREKCPARDATCNKCHKKGHYGAQCLTKQTQVSEIKEQETDSVFLGEIGQLDSAWFATVYLNGQSTRFKLDTGAEVTAISESTYEDLKGPQLSPPGKTLYGPSRQQLHTLGQFTGDFCHNGKTAQHSVFVVRDLKSNLLGLPAITSLGLVARVATTETSEPKIQSYQERFPELFQGLGNLGEPYEIHLKPGATPHCIYTPRHVPLPLRDKVKQELDKMEAMGVITKIDNPTQWCAGMVVVPKKNGKIRICVDLKPLNESILREIHPLPRVDETLAQLCGAKVFSKLDANSGFWQIPLEKSSQPLTTFITPFGRYHFTKLPFGISSAPEHFQKRMSRILSGLDGVQCLMDDVLVYGKDEEEHDSRLMETLQRIQAAGATLNPEKCEFKKTELKFLGHVVNQDGIKADPDKVSAIVEMEAPTNVSELRRFMGMTNQLGKFSPNLADLTQPLRQLLSKRSTWLWGPEQQQAFSKVKEELTKPTVLALYNPQTPPRSVQMPLPMG